LSVTDCIDGEFRKAVLRWRLSPGDWKIDGAGVTDGIRSLQIESSEPILRLEIASGYESRHYLEKSALPVLEVEIAHPGTFVSVYRWAP
jgi:hypothetical protein